MSAPTMMPRLDLTSSLLDTMNAVCLVGDCVAPDAGGWGNDPNLPSSSYQAYAVLVPQMATAISGSFGDSQSEWELPYAINCYGISREQCEFISYQARTAVLGLVKQTITLDQDNWKVTQARTNSLGGVARNDAVEPSEYSETDIVVVRMSKE